MLISAVSGEKESTDSRQEEWWMSSRYRLRRLPAIYHSIHLQRGNLVGIKVHGHVRSESSAAITLPTRYFCRLP